MPTTPPLACTLSPEQLASRRKDLLPGLLAQAARIDDLSDGFRLHFAYRAGLLAELTHIIEQERTCCGFLRFQVAVEPNDGPIAFDVTGPEGTREMLRAL